MAYCITLRCKNETKVTGWYAGSSCRWSTDHKRRKLFDDKRDARPVCHKLRSLCPRNANFIKIEVAQDDPPTDRVRHSVHRNPID